MGQAVAHHDLNSIQHRPAALQDHAVTGFQTEDTGPCPGRRTYRPSSRAGRKRTVGNPTHLPAVERLVEPGQPLGVLHGIGRRGRPRLVRRGNPERVAARTAVHFDKPQMARGVDPEVQADLSEDAKARLYPFNHLDGEPLEVCFDPRCQFGTVSKDAVAAPGAAPRPGRRRAGWK